MRSVMWSVRIATAPTNNLRQNEQLQESCSSTVSTRQNDAETSRARQAPRNTNTTIRIYEHNDYNAHTDNNTQIERTNTQIGASTPAQKPTKNPQNDTSINRAYTKLQSRYGNTHIVILITSKDCYAPITQVFGRRHLRIVRIGLN